MCVRALHHSRSIYLCVQCSVAPLPVKSSRNTTCPRLGVAAAVVEGLSYYCHGSDTRERERYTSFPRVILPAADRRPLCACVLIKYHLDGGVAWKFLAPILVFMSSAPHRQSAGAIYIHYVYKYILYHVDIFTRALRQYV